MKKIICILIVLFSALNIAQADPAEFRPLGRFTVIGDEVIYSPDGYFIASLYREEKPVEEQVQAEEPSEPECEDFSDDSCYADWEAYYEALDVYYNPPANYIYTVTLWDIRGGKQLWQTTIENRNFDTLEFAPNSSSLLIKTTLPFPDTEEVRLSFYDTHTGELISETGNINPFDSPIIPGTLDQPLYAEPYYTSDGAHVLVSYWRQTENAHCAVWDVMTGEVIWEKESRCGAISPDGRLTIIARQHENQYSDYAQVVVYDLLSGEEVSRTEDEISAFKWVGNTLVVLNRAYGDPPILWDVVKDSRAVIELPYQLGVLQPGSLERVMYQSAPDLTYIWDKANGALLGSTDIEGYICEQADRILVFHFGYENESDTLAVRDLERDENLWEMEWYHEIMSIRDDGEQMLAYSYESGLAEIISLDTGEILGTMPLDPYDSYITPDWEWVVQVSRGTYIVWGMEEYLSDFENPPMARVKEETLYYYEANKNFPGSTLRADRYVWLKVRSEDGQWVLLDENSWDNMWVPVDQLEFFIPLESLPIYE